MKYILILMLLSQPCWGKTLKENPPKIKKTQNVSLSASDAGFREPMAEPDFKPLKNKISLLGSQFQEGGVYVGGRKTPAEFSYFGLEYKRQFPNLELGVSFSTLQNQSALKVYSLLGYAGVHHNFTPEISLSGGGLLGISKLSEVTTLQNINGSGFTVGAKIDANYQFQSGLFLSGGVYWYHPMFAKSFWGEDLFSEVVIDFIGPTFSIGWSW